MLIDLNKFTKVRDVIVPIIDGWGQSNGRKIFAHYKLDGWYRVQLGNSSRIMGLASPLEVLKTLEGQPFLRVYALGLEGVATNFDNFLRKGFNEAVNVNFLNLPIFEVAKVVLWEDNRFYYYEEDVRFQRELIKNLKEAFDKEQSIVSIKGLTPEIRYYWLLINLERQAFREVEKLTKLKLSEAEKRKRVEQFQNTFEGRLKKTIEDAGGEFIRFSKANKDTYLVHWKLGSQIVKSTIRDNLQIMSAGYCLNSSDRQHSMSSIIQLAKMFQERAPLYITRE